MEVLEIFTKYKESTEYKNSEEKYQDLMKHQDVWINRLRCHIFLNTKTLKRRSLEESQDKSRLAEEYLEQFIESLKKCQYKNFYLKLDANFLYSPPYPKRKEYIRRI
ncbi:hypothetical protein Lsai_1982 [Legionella sainthelensi]|uniref:Uncharacterized protein n=1 Tax=Legionella sainthelensi TaxID=28087 RepID=A0A0W0YH23_9GAMM|nr:hypothetical protein [Legionella sainthelensi]KTD56265.1 hypothetical protein Lsai_1982 [Legionella sainthelensi]VEH31973.1 Uncharacterised protein [Legionella sainthelensi]